VGEGYWDAACVLTGALFAFRVVRRYAGFRWGLIGAVVTLGLFDCTMIVMGSIIGAGVFQAPRDIAARMGSLEGILLVWAAGGVIATLGF
jgi:hypothetical protein